VIVIPLAIIILTEVLERLERRKSPLAPTISLIRDVILPLMALFILLRYIIELDDINWFVRFIATIFFAALIVAIFRFSSNLFSKTSDEPSWHDQIPIPIKRLPAFLIASLISVHLIQNVWNIPVTEMATTLGIGSFAIAFALQDTLSNLVSGLLLLINRPFIADEWIQVDDTLGCVIEINWRYTQIETLDGNLVTIPNGSIYQLSIKNYSRPTKLTRITQPIDIAFVTPPNKVRDMLVEIMRQTPGILAEPAPTVYVTRIDDPLMGYETCYWIADFTNKLEIHNDFMTRIWYVSKRHEVPFPSPAYDLFHYDGPISSQAEEVTPERIAIMLQSIHTFSSLSDDDIVALSKITRLFHYARSEKIISVGQNEEGFSVLISGTAQMMASDVTGTLQNVRNLGRENFFGETGLFGRAISPYTIVAHEDTEILQIDYSGLNRVINHQPQFAEELNAVINERRSALQRLAGIDVQAVTVVDTESIQSINRLGINR